MLSALSAGFALRLLFILTAPDNSDDTFIYGSIAANLLRHGAYALSRPSFHLTLIRLPGYPLFLASIFACFGVDHYRAVMWVQAGFDLAGCLLVAAFVGDRISGRCAAVALWLAVLCPFTANYVAIPMTETLSILAVSLALFTAGRLIGSVQARARIAWPPLFGLAAALGGAVLLRPDGALLAAAILPTVLWYGLRAGRAAAFAALRGAIVCGLLAASVLLPWTLRNELRFHRFEPLAPRFATDPGVFIPQGYIRWSRSWLAEFASNEEFYWDGNETTLHADFLPARAFDTPAQRARTLSLVAAYNAACQPLPLVPPDDQDAAAPICRISPAQDRLFTQLADERFAAHPLRRHVGLPLLRLADMWLRPRVEYMSVPLRWWQPREHPLVTLFAVSYATLNAALLLAASFGFLRRRVPLAGMMLAYIALRCALLLTLENAEPRYTLECFPMLLAAAALALTRRSNESRQTFNPS